LSFIIFVLFDLKAPAAYPYPDPYYRSIFAPYDAQPYAPQAYGALPMVISFLMLYAGLFRKHGCSCDFSI
jgi:hypothetical protein